MDRAENLGTPNRNMPAKNPRPQHRCMMEKMTGKTGRYFIPFCQAKVTDASKLAPRYVRGITDARAGEKGKIAPDRTKETSNSGGKS